MKIRISVDRVSALKAGKDRHGLMVVEVPASEFTKEEVEILGSYTLPPAQNRTPEADFYLDAAGYYSGDPARRAPKVATEPTPEAVHLVLKTIAEDIERAEKEKEDREREKKENDRQAILKFMEGLRELAKMDDTTLAQRGLPYFPYVNSQNIPEYEEASRLNKSLKDRIDAEGRRVKAEKEAIRELADRDKLDWIKAHGSDFLRKASDAGYDCQRRYVTERAVLEYPGFAVDFDDLAGWKERACPSEAALDAALGFGDTCRVVWLTQPVEREGEEDWEAREALVVEDFLGKYDLVREL